MHENVLCELRKKHSYARTAGTGPGTPVTSFGYTCKICNHWTEYLPQKLAALGALYGVRVGVSAYL